MAGRINDQIDHWLFEEYRVDQADLSLYRKLYAVLAVALYFPHALWTAGIPAHFWNTPPSLTSLLDGPPPMWVLLILNALFLWFCFALYKGEDVPGASIGVGVTLLLLNNVYYSFGKIDHDILFPLTAICLAFSGWDGRSQQRPWCLAFLALIIGIAMFTAAWPKFAGGWLSLDSHAVQSTAQRYMVRPHRVIGTELAVEYTPTWLWEVHDWAAVLLEAGVIVAAYRLRWLRAILLVAMLFHMGVLITFGIAFAVNVVVYAAFFPLSRLWKPALACLPIAVVMSLTLCNWYGYRGFLWHTIVMLGGVMALGYLVRLTATTVRRR